MNQIFYKIITLYVKGIAVSWLHFLYTTNTLNLPYISAFLKFWLNISVAVGVIDLCIEYEAILRSKKQLNSNQLIFYIIIAYWMI